MVDDQPMANDIDLQTFLKSAGQSFTDAQKALTPGLDVSVNMMLTNAELELKVAVSADAQGKMSIRPISSLDLVRGGIDPGMLSTIKVSFVSSAAEIKAEPPRASTGDSPAKGTVVPALVGLTLDGAVALLKAAGWRYEAHAAGVTEVAAASKENRGRVLRQDPQAGRSVDKTVTTLRFWADLGSIAVAAIDGIGARTTDGLAGIGIKTVGELSLASAAQVASTLGISGSRAQVFVDMAALMSRLAILGFADEVVELLVKGAGIRSVEQLAGADAKDLYRLCQEAVASGKVRVPRGFGFTIEEVNKWTLAGRNYLDNRATG